MSGEESWGSFVRQTMEGKWQCPTCLMLNTGVQCPACETMRTDSQPRTPKGDGNEQQEGKHSLLTDLSNPLKNDELADVVFQVENERIPAHKAILAARSNYFRTMFCGGMRESNDKQISIDGVSAPTFRRLLEYLYTGKIGGMDIYESMDLLECADMHQLVGLKEICEKRVPALLTAGNVLHVFRCGRLTNSDYVMSCACYHIYTFRHDPSLAKSIKEFPIESVEDGQMIREVLIIILISKDRRMNKRR